MGGLFLRGMEFHNSLLLQKTACRFLSFPNSLWVQVLFAKYGLDGDALDFAKNSHLPLPVTCSSSCKGMLSALKDLSRGLFKRIGDGPSTSFWYDTWLYKPLVDCMEVIPDYVDANVRESDFIFHGIWNLFLTRSKGIEDYIRKQNSTSKPVKRVLLQQYYKCGAGSPSLFKILTSEDG